MSQPEPTYSTIEQYKEQIRDLQAEVNHLVNLLGVLGGFAIAGSLLAFTLAWSGN